MNNNKKIIGNIFTLNPKSKIIVLINKKKGNVNYNISIINITEIKKIELSKNQLDINLDELGQNDLNHVEKKRKNKYRKR